MMTLHNCHVGDMVKFKGNQHAYQITEIEQNLNASWRFAFKDETGTPYSLQPMDANTLTSVNGVPNHSLLPDPPEVTDDDVANSITELKELCQTSQAH